MDIKSETFKERLYKRYIDTHFGKHHKDAAGEMGTYRRYFGKNYSRFLPKDKNARILDLGCGMGHFLHFLKKEGYNNVVGLDIGKETVSYCRNNGFMVEQVDLFKYLEKNNEPFDIIVMNDLIEHLSKEQVILALDLICKNLSINGKVIIKVVNAANPVLGNSSRYLDFTHEVGFTEESLSQVLEICEFKDIAVYPQNIYVFYLNPVNYLARFAAGLLNIVFRSLFLLYGRSSTKLFTKSIIAVATRR